jgi:putative nucleotidyltransferase with HDIG domain
MSSAGSLRSWRHLARRFWGSLSQAEPPIEEVDWAHRLLLPAEAELWDRMAVQDRRHSVQVARRFVELAPDASPSEVAGALLHDVGKLQSGLGTCSRVMATMVGSRGQRFGDYHHHESIGAEMLRAAGSASVTIDLVLGHGVHAASLRAADDV